MLASTAYADVGGLPIMTPSSSVCIGSDWVPVSRDLAALVLEPGMVVLVNDGVTVCFMKVATI